MDADAGRIVGVEQEPQGSLRPQRLPVGRRRATPFPRESSQSLAPMDPTEPIIDDYRDLAAASENHSIGQATQGIGCLEPIPEPEDPHP